MRDGDIWQEAIRSAVEQVGTPCYVVAAPIIQRNLRRLQSLFHGFRTRHLLSVKTQPIRPLLEIWNDAGLPVEVVSEFELSAAVEVGFDPSNIVVNGVGKAAWLSRYELPGLCVHLDSPHEATTLVDQARLCRWSVGVRLNLPPSIEFDPDEPHFGTQFGLTLPEATDVYALLRAKNVSLGGVHFHIGTDVRTHRLYEDAITWVRNQIGLLGWRLRYVDIGGGLPSEDRCCPGGFDLDAYRLAVVSLYELAGTEEVWLENGRFISSTAGVLVVRVIDLKHRGGVVYAICDGGRTNHALVSDWEQGHSVHVLPGRSGPTALTTVCGPSCMAFDRLGRFELPALQVGDLIVWSNAGAYHVPWETRFSAGRCAVVWLDEAFSARVARSREAPRDWWSEWNAVQPPLPK